MVLLLVKQPEGPISLHATENLWVRADMSMEEVDRSAEQLLLQSTEALRGLHIIGGDSSTAQGVPIQAIWCWGHSLKRRTRRLWVSKPTAPQGLWHAVPVAQV